MSYGTPSFAVDLLSKREGKKSPSRRARGPNRLPNTGSAESCAFLRILYQFRHGLSTKPPLDNRSGGGYNDDSESRRFGDPGGRLAQLREGFIS